MKRRASPASAFEKWLSPPAGTTSSENWTVSSSGFVIPDALQPAVTSHRHPEVIGRYRIIRVLGQGGMGIVYEAEQDRPRRTVALKVIKPGFAGPDLLRRFELEAEALGRLQHPGIAQIYEAGVADCGSGLQPYFAMELIRGEPVLQYAGTHDLDANQRLELIAKICEAVHHAHQRGIIHRDLKPVNILVEAGGQPRVLDFGVARLTDSDTEATRQTEMGQIIGTLAYMSPEQVLGDPLDLDTVSDVYSLGVISFELLCGRLPYKIPTQLHEAVRAIRDYSPARLGAITRKYRGDIETIVSKALEKEKTRRYESAAGFADDIRRYLRNEPIVARPPSTTYQLQKLAHRHKGLVASVLAVFIVFLAGIVVSTGEAMRARTAERAAIVERNRADTEAATAKAVNDFLRDDLLARASASSQAQPGTNPDPDLKVRTALDRAAMHVTNRFDNQPLVEASIRETIANAYMDLGLYPQAQQQIERAVELRRRALGANHPDTLNSMDQLAVVVLSQGNYARAEALYTNLLELMRQAQGAEHPRRLTAMKELGYLYVNEGKYAQAKVLFTKVLEVRRRTLRAEDPLMVGSLESLAFLYLTQGDYAQAEPLYTEVLEGVRRHSGDQHPDTLNAVINLATVYRHQGKYAQAERMLTDALEIQRGVLGLEHPLTLNGMRNLAGLYRDTGRYKRSERVAMEALGIAERVFGDTHHLTLLVMEELALTYGSEGKYAEAEALYAKVLRLEATALGGEHPKRLATMNDFALVYLDQRQYVKAERLVRAALDGYGKTTTDTWNRYNSESLLGASLAGQKKYAEAEPMVLSGYAGMTRLQSFIPAGSRFNLTNAQQRIVQLYQSWGRRESAKEWREKLHLAGGTTSGG